MCSKTQVVTYTTKGMEETHLTCTKTQTQGVGVDGGGSTEGGGKQHIIVHRGGGITYL